MRHGFTRTGCMIHSGFWFNLLLRLPCWQPSGLRHQGTWPGIAVPGQALAVPTRRRRVSR
jgi:hypothetical protein